MSDWAVEIDNLVKTFGTFVAVDHVSLQVPKGEIFGFLGPNGAGKSTTIRMLCGLLSPTSGRASVAGIDVTADPEGVRRNIGYMSQKFSLYDDLTVEQNIDFFTGMYGVPRELRQSRKDYVLRMANLTERRGSLTGTLSGGWKQRLALGCAILHDPPVVFLDEPTSGVDPIARATFWELIAELARTGHTVFVTTHYMDEAEYCNRLALMYAGKVIALGDPAGLKRAAQGAQLAAPGYAGAARHHAGHRTRRRHSRSSRVRQRPARGGGRCGGRHGAHSRGARGAQASPSGGWSRSNPRSKTCSWP